MRGVALSQALGVCDRFHEERGFFKSRAIAIVQRSFQTGSYRIEFHAGGLFYLRGSIC